MTDINVKIRAKGCNATGITDDLAQKMYNAKGSRHMAIVEFKVDETHEKADGDRKVDLVITEIEPVVDDNIGGQLDDHIRTIQGALFRNRKLNETGAELPFDDDGPAPKVKDVLAAGMALLETDENGEPALWDGEHHADDQTNEQEPANGEDADLGDGCIIEHSPGANADCTMAPADEERPATNPFTVVPTP